MRKVDVCLTPELLHLYGVKNRVVVIVDILRATSCMTVAIANGVEKIIPVAKLEECQSLRQKGCVGAAERDGKMPEGFDLGNSPLAYLNNAYAGKTIAMTTTNGTLAISKSKDAEEVIIGSFLNKTAVINYLISQPNDVLIVCAGWKGKVNLEDTLFAGAVVEGLKDHFEIENDAVIASATLYNYAKKDMLDYLSACSHVKRLKNLHIQKDIEFCLREDQFNVIPVLKEDALVDMEKLVLT
ncbi:2-phosphosulfolactate phosphatase [Sporocytophaga myxococcoides]|uniref:Probable 2-phosphosulfolactate phosphatase n=1 Tax=Sporocytophaga myxococcoides TaxID=153721 RepID=A0A098L8P1_9BACT|nr:2-phosphosulfolactate phosphatase [Sporocytophaga myxococcoides]GAL82792.1 2-phosphosulfolactate phosphatase [Sporocytophaga myxococcoides]